MGVSRRDAMVAAARLRRMMPRNADAMLVCGYVEQSANEPLTYLPPVSSVSGPVSMPVSYVIRPITFVSAPVSTAPKTDRRAYMRELMRKRRAAARAPT